MLPSSDRRKWSAPPFCAEAMEPRVLLAASLVQDLNPAPSGSSLTVLGHVGKVAIFEEEDHDHGSELYRSDGSKSGTFMLRDIVAGPTSSDPSFFAATDNAIYFTVDSGFLNTIWKTDGTVAGTTKVADVEPLGARSGPHVVVGNTLFFIGVEFLKFHSRTALWKTDGTSAGAVRLSAEIANESLNAYQTMGALNGVVYFAANDTAHGTELWRSDGTSAGTRRFADLAAGPGSSNPTNFVATSDRLFFVDAVPNSAEQHLWKTDGQSVRLVDTSENSSLSNPGISSMTAIGDRLYYLANKSGAVGAPDSLWRATGKSNTLLRIAKIVEPSIVPIDPNGGALDRLYVRGSTSGVPTTYYSVEGDTLTPLVANTATETIVSAAQIGNDLYFGTKLVDGSGVKTFKADTEAGKTLLKSFAGVHYIDDFLAFGSKVYFVTASKESADGAPLTTVLWISDGTSNNTVKDVSFKTPAILSLDSGGVAGDRLYFAPYTLQSGRELWISDGSPGTHLIRDIDPRTATSIPRGFTSGVGGTYFTAFGSDGVQGSYILNESTHQITQLVPFYSRFLKLGAVEILVGMNQIWRSDGTKAGTKSIYITGGIIRDPAIAGKSLYFGVSADYSSPTDIWKSDGTANGTTLFRENFTIANGTAFKNSLIFGGGDSGGLWTTDGTAAGTRKIADLGPSKFYNFGNALYFFSGHPDGTVDLWRTDGTAKGTTRVKSGVGSGNVAAVATDGLYFYNGVNLWRSDGTTSGTKLLKTFNSDQYDVFITAVGNRVYFDAGALWTSSGGKTVLLKSIRVDLPPGDEGDSVETSPVDTVAGPNGKFYFAADDGVHGFELWETDATPTGTKLVKDILPGAGDSTPTALAIAGNTLFFSADDGVHGIEPWQFPLD